MIEGNIGLVGFDRSLSSDMGYTGGTVVKNLPANAGDVEDMDSIPGPERPPGEGNANSL